MIKSRIGLSVFLLILLGIIWGSGYSIARYAMTHGVPPLGYSFWQSLGPAVVLLVICLIKERKLRIAPRYLRYYLVAGLLGIALPNTNMYFAAPHLPAGILAVIVNTVPIMMYPLALIARQERFSQGRLIGVLLGVVGIMMIVGSKWSLPEAGTLKWALITLLSPLFFATCALYSVHDRPEESSSLSLAAGMLVCSVIVLAPFVVDTHEFYPLNSFSLPNMAVVLEIILSSIGYVILFQLWKIAGAVYYSFVGGVVAITGLFWGWLLFGETIHLWTLLAVVLIVVAITTVSLLQSRQQQQG
jgi:drug/metabolite transporter (DMT)-like permease